MAKTIDNVTCLACGCVCDDLKIQVSNGRVITAERTCSISEPLLVGSLKAETGVAEIEGEKVSLETAIERAAEILGSSSAPLLYGLAESTVEAQSAAIALADRLGATLDPALSPFHRASLIALQSVGISTCTLGEVKQRGDVVLFWGCDPAATHPRLFERFIDPPGKFVLDGRQVVVLAAERNATFELADECLHIQPGSDFEVLTALRAIVAGVQIEEKSFGGIPYEQLHGLAAKLQAANYSVIFFGAGIAEHGDAPVSLESLFLLVRELNDSSRCAAIGLGGPLAENVLTWQTGFPCAVNFAAGYPRYDPDAYSASRLLECGEVDAMLMIGSKGFEHLSKTARERLAGIPVILFETTRNTLIGKKHTTPMVRMSVAQAGMHCDGSVFRMDGVPLPIRPIIESQLKSEAEVLAAINESLFSQCV